MSIIFGRESGTEATSVAACVEVATAPIQGSSRKSGFLNGVLRMLQWNLLVWRQTHYHAGTRFSPTTSRLKQPGWIGRARCHLGLECFQQSRI